jgi:hypothetical protein
MIAVYIIYNVRKHREIIGKLVFDGQKVQWEYNDGNPGTEEILDLAVVRHNDTYYSDKNPKEWIENLHWQLNNGYINATEPIEE